MSNTASNNGWGAWQNVKKENDFLKSKLNECSDTILKKTTKSEADKNESEMIKKIIIKKKQQVKELLLEAETKKQELTNTIRNLNDKYKEFEKTNNDAVEKIIQKINLYKEMIDSDEEPEPEVINIKLNKKKTIKNDTLELKNEIFVGSLKETIKDIDLFNLFQKYGEIERCRVLTNIVEGKVASKCCGFVRYKDIKSAMNAIKSLNVTYTNISMYPLQLEYSKSNRKENDYDISNQYNILKM